MSDLNNKIFEKWSPIINSIEKSSLTTIDNGLPILPIAIKIASKTIGHDLVGVNGLTPTISPQEIIRIRNEVKRKNRDSKIDSILEGKEFKELKTEDHPDWKNFPSAKLFYMDFKYSE